MTNGSKNWCGLAPSTWRSIAPLKWRSVALSTVAAIAFSVLPPTGSFAQKQGTSVPVRLGAHQTYTRVVVDFTRRTAYRISRTPSDITLTFDTPAKLAVPGDSEKFISALHAGKPAAGTAVLNIETPPATAFRDYRDGQKIVIDLYADAKKAAAQKTASDKSPPAKTAAPKTTAKNTGDKTTAVTPAKNQPAPPALTKESLTKAINDTLNAPDATTETPAPKDSAAPEKSALIGPPAPAAKTATAAPKTETPTVSPAPAPAAATSTTTTTTTTTTAAPAPATTATTATAAPATDTAATQPATPAAPAAPATPANPATPPATANAEGTAPKSMMGPAEPPEDPTVISLSTIDPARLAVFKRFGTLWLVLDTSAGGAIPPNVTGPHAQLLGLPNTMTFSGGSAYRFDLAEDKQVTVEKKGLTWRIMLGGTELPLPAAAQLNVEVEEVSNKAKLMAELKDGGKVIELQDPKAGDTLEVIPTSDPAQRIDDARRYADLEVIPAAIGMAVRPLNDDVHVNRIQDFVLVTAPNGLAATPNASAGPAAVESDSARRDETRLFDFPNWRKGGAAHLSQNAAELENRISRATKADDRTALLMKLALLYFANNFGHEALGVLNIIQDESPGMDKNPNFIALRGAASAMAGHYAEALSDLSTPAIQNHAEVSLWIGYAAAATEQWRMANRSFPADNYLLRQYPENIATPFTIYMAESALRLGHTDTAKTLLGSLDAMSAGFDQHSQAAVQYLKGEAARQAGDTKNAINLWRPVAFGLDRLYHTKASLALANLELQEKNIPLKDAIDRVDSLRFAWRGDGLEVQILQNLGSLKIQDKKYLLGLEDMKSAAALADSMQGDGQSIRDDMGRIVSDLFLGGKAKDIAPLEAASVYTEFSDLMPKGADSALAAVSFADNLIAMDLLDKAEDLLAQQIKNPALPPEKLPSLHNKLAAVYLLDSQPQKSLDALGTDSPATEERALLKARALSELGQTDDAIAALAPLASKDALKLKADVLWRAKKWDQAAATIETLLPTAPTTPLADADAQLVVNAAVAYKLAENQDGLADIKKRYAANMVGSPLASTFGVVTRPIGKSALADRDTILKIAGEVDMFKDFLDSYKGKGS